eukprot:TRINITY_DN2991_c0_g1_i1.p1 TRINITY_DN2991_c0_g1~~TRINITY_DN2991_c0_g1_i1.p1  ORF type:complete len:122 (+),score=37.33 TRINITY_DN2991_c0_g1_i1:148-513(+)
MARLQEQQDMAQSTSFLGLPFLQQCNAADVTTGGVTVTAEKLTHLRKALQSLDQPNYTTLGFLCGLFKEFCHQGNVASNKMTANNIAISVFAPLGLTVAGEIMISHAESLFPKIVFEPKAK